MNDHLWTMLSQTNEIRHMHKFILSNSSLSVPVSVLTSLLMGFSKGNLRQMALIRLPGMPMGNPANFILKPAHWTSSLRILPLTDCTFKHILPLLPLSSVALIDASILLTRAPAPISFAFAFMLIPHAPPLACASPEQITYSFIWMVGERVTRIFPFESRLRTLPGSISLRNIIPLFRLEHRFNSALTVYPTLHEVTHKEIFSLPSCSATTSVKSILSGRLSLTALLIWANMLFEPMKLCNVFVNIASSMSVDCGVG